MITPPSPAIGAAPPRETSDRSTPPANHTRLTAFADGDTPSFWDLLDVINPLHHIPGVNLLYRELTGDAIGTAPRLAGGALFGGLIGLGASLADLVLEGLTGRDAGETVMAMFEGGPDDQPTRVATTLAPPAPAPDQMQPSPVMAEPRFFPLPPRGLRAVPAFLPGPAAMPPAPTVKGAVVAQGLQGTNHPLLGPSAADAGAPPWFESTVLDALDKYQRGARLGGPAPDGR